MSFNLRLLCLRNFMIVNILILVICRRKAEKKDWQLETKLMKMDKNKTGFEHLTGKYRYSEED